MAQRTNTSQGANVTEDGMKPVDESRADARRRCGLRLAAWVLAAMALLPLWSGSAKAQDHPVQIIRA